MYLTGANGQLWGLEESLREKAKILIDIFPEKLGHINLDLVAFVRTISTRSSDKWYGKCWYIRLPLSIIPIHTLTRMKDDGVIDVPEIEKIDVKYRDIRYIIGLNDDKITTMNMDISVAEKMVLLHELCHIKRDMDGIEDHDIKDFRWMLDSFGVNWDLGMIENKYEHDSNLFEESD